MSHEDKTDRELLIETRKDVEWLKCLFEKHLAQHSRLIIAGVGVTGTLIVGLILALVV